VRLSESTLEGRARTQPIRRNTQQLGSVSERRWTQNARREKRSGESRVVSFRAFLFLPQEKAARVSQTRAAGEKMKRLEQSHPTRNHDRRQVKTAQVTP